tara:strand:+ start:2708 stop:2899 length:192 start_codon:yes stop_codon:yes gene_type:complete
MEQNTFLFLIYLAVLVWCAYTIGKNTGVRMASERAIDMLLAMGVIKELPNKEIVKGDNDERLN